MTFAGALSYDLWHLPVQVSDSLGEILEAQQSPSAWSTFTRGFGSSGYLRPLRLAQIKALFDLSHGRYRLAYRGFHIALLVALFILFARALRVGSTTELAAASFGLTVLVGLHTFAGLVREAFPINHFLEIAVACLAALNLAQSRGGWHVDVAAAVLFVAAVLTLESGLLVWVVIVAARISGLRGLSTRGVALVSALLAGYFVLRFGYLATGVPDLAERSAGFMLERLEAHEVQRRFGDAPSVFYAYNVAASVLSVLAAEPRDGVLVTALAWRDGALAPRIVLPVAASVATTTLIFWWGWSAWRKRAPLSPAHRMAVIGAAVLAASAALSFAYTKDEIMAVAGVFYALAAFGAACAVIERVGSSRRVGSALVVSTLLLAGSSAWALRALSIDHRLRYQAFRVRNDWAEVHITLASEDRVPRDERGRQLVDALRTTALDMPVPNPHLLPAWNGRWFDD